MRGGWLYDPPGGHGAKDQIQGGEASVLEDRPASICEAGEAGLSGPLPIRRYAPRPLPEATVGCGHSAECGGKRQGL